MNYEIMRTDVLNVIRTMLRMGLTLGDSGSVSARVGEAAGRVLLANHGALAVGKDLKAALIACQFLEKCAMAFLYATWAGQVNCLPPQVA